MQVGAGFGWPHDLKPAGRIPVQMVRFDVDKVTVLIEMFFADTRQHRVVGTGIGAGFIVVRVQGESRAVKVDLEIGSILEVIERDMKT